MAFNRKDFKGASTKAQKKVQEKEPKQKGFSNGNSYHKVEDGSNYFRLAPPHNSEHSLYALYRTAMLECDVPIYEDGEKTDKIERKKKKIISATVHNDELAALGVDGDPIELYIKMVEDWAWQNKKDKKEREKYLKHVRGYRAMDGKWVWGIKPKNDYQSYAWDRSGELAILTLYPQWVKDMDRVGLTLGEEGEPLEIDPFSNPDEGYPLMIDRDKDDKGKWVYTISAGKPSRAKKESWDDFFERTALSDAQLEALSELKSLHERYVNNYKMKDFELAINGLQIFDDKYKYNMFQDETFNDKLEIINGILEKQAAESGDSETEESTPQKEKEAEPKEKEAVVAEKETTEMSVADKYDFVKEYVTEVYGAEFVPQIKKRGPKLTEWFDLAMADGEIPIEAVEAEEKPEGVMEQIAALRKQRDGN